MTFVLDLIKIVNCTFHIVSSFVAMIVHLFISQLCHVQKAIFTLINNETISQKLCSLEIILRV